MTKLEEIKERLFAADLGVWVRHVMRVAGYHGDKIEHYIEVDERKIAVDSIQRRMKSGELTITIRGREIYLLEIGMEVPDAVLMQHAPTDIAYLLGEVERLQAKIAGLRELLRYHQWAACCRESCGGGTCPECYNDAEGHKPDCALWQAIKEE